MSSKKFSSSEADGWLPFSALPCEKTMKHYNSSPRLNNQTANHSRERNNRKGFWLSTLGLRFSLRDYAYCMATLLLFCMGSLFYQLNGGPPKVLLEFRQYLGKFSLRLVESCRNITVSNSPAVSPVSFIMLHSRVGTGLGSCRASLPKSHVYAYSRNVYLSHCAIVKSGVPVKHKR